ncbi:MAG: MFS transporter [Candidatus Binatia bacterium]|nr:MAG: MFS transporter [Candidatus Binatia bacterium]
MGARERKTRYLLLLVVLWGALSFHWTVLSNNILPTRALEFSTPATKGRILGLVTVLGALVAMLTSPLAGVLSDESRSRWGRRKPFLLLGVVAGSASLFALVGARTLAGFLLSVASLQFFLHVASAPYTALLPDQVTDRQKGRATGFAGFADVLGRLCGAIVGGLFVSLPEWAEILGGMLPFLPVSVRSSPMLPLVAITSGVLLVALVVTLLAVEDPPAESPPASRRGSLWRRAFRLDVRAEPNFAWLLFSRGANMLALATITTFLLYYIHDYLGVADIREANAKLGYLFAASSLTTLPSSVAVGYWIDRHGRRKAWVVASSLGLALVSLGLIAVRSFPEVLVLGMFFGFFYGAFFTSDWSLALHLLPRDGAVARSLGIWMIAGTLPQVIAPGVGGVLLDFFNGLGPNLGYPALFLSVVGYLALGIGFLLPVREPGHDFVVDEPREPE